MNPHIISSSLHTSLGRNSYDEIDERLFDSYLDISGNKALFTKSSFSSPVLSEEDSDSSSSLKRSVIGTGRKLNKQSVLNRRLNDAAKLPLKKEESDSESESERSKHTKKSKSKKANVPKDNESDKKQKNLYKTELCRNWEETGHCRYGVKCQYAHGSKDLRQVERHPKYKTQKCRTFHQTGSCPYGARCTFRHYDLPGDKEELSETSSVATAEEEEEEEEELSIHYDDSEASSMFSANNQNMLHQHWFGQNTSLNTASPLVDEGLMDQFSNTLLFDPEDSLLPSNAESLLPHELLFDLESPQEEKKTARCPLRDYVTLPNLSHFQMPQQENEAPASLCKSLFKPWLF